MDRQQLLQLIRQKLAQDLPVQQGLSYAASIRDLQRVLAGLKSTTPPPSDPLPSAECVAAFVDGELSAAEERQVVAACIHDVGILLQVVSTAAAESTAEVASVESQLLSRLNQLRQLHPTSIPLPVSNRVSVQASAAVEKQIAPQVLMPVQLAAEANTLPRDGARSNTLNGYGWLMVVAAGIVLALGWLALQPEARDNEPQQAAVESGDNRDRFSPPPQLVERKPAPSIAETPGTATDNKNAQESEHTPPEQLVGQPSVAPSAQERPQTKPPMPLSTDTPSVKLASRVNVEWIEITGVLAEQTEVGYDRWRVVQTQSTMGPADSGKHWLTLPSCFAKGSLSSGGQLILGEQTSLRTLVDDHGTALDLQFGAIAIRGAPAELELRIVSDSESSPQTLSVEATASFEMRRAPQGLELIMESGALQLAGTRLRAGQSYRLANTTVEILETRQLSPWYERLPKTTNLSSELLAALVRSEDLAQSLDQEITKLSQTINFNNPRSVSRFVELCRWRASVGVESVGDVLQHPLWPVRMAAFDELISTTSRLPSLAARRELLSRLPRAERDRIRLWFLMASGKQRPTRQDAASWLGLLTQDDLQVSAFGDYLLRKCFAGGPNFDPAASARLRDTARKAWAKAVADAR
ncbi:MAG: hypothetical protein R3C53_23140 [Pirellulaceae bacterium]